MAIAVNESSRKLAVEADDLNEVNKEAKAKKAHAGENLSSIKVSLLGIALLAVTTGGFYNIPGMMDEKASGSRLVNALFCSVMTLTTVGFGDICPADDLSIAGKAFIMIVSFVGLGMFCGPVLTLGASWSLNVPGGMISLTVVTIALGVAIFTYVEGLSEQDAAYMSFITGTTIGYGDITPTSDEGKIAIALYAILVINVMSGLLQPARVFFEGLCRQGPSSERQKKEE